MKNSLKLFVAIAVAALTFTGCNCFSKMGKNQDQVKVTCTPDVLTLNNGKVEADITVNFPAKYYNKKAVLKVTPIMVFEGGIIEGATKYFQGSKVKDNYTVVNTMGGEFTQHIEFPYDARMAKSDLKLLVEVKCPSGPCKVFTVINANTGALPTKAEAADLAAGGVKAEALKAEFALPIAKGVNTLQSDLDYAAAMSNTANNYKNVTTVVTKADIVYKINSSRVAKKAVETEELNALKAGVEAYKANDRVAQSLYVNGYASPDGPEKFNDKLSDKRSQSGLKAVQKLLADTGLNIDAAAYGEDWEGFKAAVAASDIKDKDLILQVLSMYSSSAEREKEIKNLSSVYGELKDDVLPELRRAQIVNSTDIQGKTDVELMAAANQGQEMTVEEYLFTAQELAKTPEQAVLFLKEAAKQYPNDARVWNNLGVALTKAGEKAEALKAFEKAAKVDPSADLNKNLLLANLANGNTAAAKKYAAAADGEAKAAVAAAEGNYQAAAAQLEGYNAAIAYVMNNDLAAAKKALANEVSADADYLRAVIAAKEGQVAQAKAQLKSAIAKAPELAEKAAKDVLLKAIMEA